MKFQGMKIAFVLITCLVVFASALLGDQLTFTTFYPAPFGIYDRIRLVPQDSLPENPFCDDQQDLGVIYYDNGYRDRIEGIYVCQKVKNNGYIWILASSPLKVNPEIVTDQKVVCVKSDGNFGVCVNNPSGDGTCGCY